MSDSSVRTATTVEPAGGSPPAAELVAPKGPENGDSLTGGETPEQLREEIARLSQANDDLKRLLYIASHDLREPLRAMRGFSKILVEKHSDGLNDKARDFLQRIQRGAGRLDRLLDEVLVMSRAQRQVVPDVSLPLRRLAEDALVELDVSIRASEASVVLEGEFEVARVNRAWVTQAIANLVGNALKFVDDEEKPDITIVPYEPRQREPLGVGVVVKDRGPGVKSEAAERIFELFRREANQDVPGTGAGLAIVREVARRHEGDSWVRQRDGGGAEFVLALYLKVVEEE